MLLAFLIAILSCLCLTGTDASAAQIVGIGGKCLNVQGGIPNDGARIILWPCSGTENEQWFRRGRQIVGLGGKCLNVKGGGAADGTPIILWPCSGTSNERWYMDRRGQIRGIGGKCLNVRGGGDADGTEIILWTCTGGAPNEVWRIR